MTSRRSLKRSGGKFYEEDSLLLSPTFPLLNSGIDGGRVATILHYLPTGSSIIKAEPGAGEVVLALTGRGYAAAAVEHSPISARRLSRLTGIPVQVGDFADQNLPEAAYDAYCSFHVIEHVVDFRSTWIRHGAA